MAPNQIVFLICEFGRGVDGLMWMGGLKRVMEGTYDEFYGCLLGGGDDVLEDEEDVVGVVTAWFVLVWLFAEIQTWVIDLRKSTVHNIESSYECYSKIS